MAPTLPVRRGAGERCRAAAPRVARTAQALPWYAAGAFEEENGQATSGEVLVAHATCPHCLNQQGRRLKPPDEFGILLILRCTAEAVNKGLGRLTALENPGRM